MAWHKEVPVQKKTQPIIYLEYSVEHVPRNTQPTTYLNVLDRVIPTSYYTGEFTRFVFTRLSSYNCKNTKYLGNERCKGHTTFTGRLTDKNLLIGPLFYDFTVLWVHIT